MTSSGNSLGVTHLVLVLSGIAFFVIGLSAPMATLDQLFLPPDTYSLLVGVIDLFRESEWLIGVIIFAFSILFPLAKFLALLWIYFRCRQGLAPGINIGVLELLGKWSMLDVFVLAITFGAANLGVLSQVEIHWGIYFYAAAVIISIYTAMLFAWQLEEQESEAREKQRQFLLPGLGFLCFLAGIFLPLAEIEKWIFWDRSYSLISALPALVGESELLMPLFLLAFVILLPLAHFLLLANLRWRKKPSAALQRWAYFVEKWAMFDVYLLALVLVLVKLNDSTSVELQSGFWALLAATILSWIDRYQVLRKRYAG